MGGPPAMDGRKNLKDQPAIMPRTFSGSSVTELIQTDMEVETEGNDEKKEIGENGEMTRKEQTKEEIEGETSNNLNNKDDSGTKLLKTGKIKTTNSLIINTDKPKPSIINDTKCNINTEKYKIPKKLETLSHKPQTNKNNFSVMAR